MILRPCASVEFSTGVLSVFGGFYDTTKKLVKILFDG